MLRALSRTIALATLWLAALSALGSALGCNMTKFAVGTTSKVLVAGQPAMKQESDYELAARAMPGSLKTVEAFHLADPENPQLTKILAEGFCQYASGFIEDEWEVAVLARDFEQIEYHSERATKSFLRCMGYGLEMLGGDWKAALYGDFETFRGKVARAGVDDRDGMLWIAIGLAGAINQNKDDIRMIAQLPKAKVLLERLAALDEGDTERDPALRALPHIALGSMAVALSAAMGGQPEVGKRHLERAFAITGDRYLLAKVYLARRYAVAVQDRELFRSTLSAVLKTDPAIWPDQRLANEIAHRRARRYLKHEKEWF